MNNFVEHVLPFTTQADADNVFVVPLAVNQAPMTLVEAVCQLTAVANSPTALTLDVDITDGTTTNAVIAAGSVGVAAGQTRLTPDSGSDPLVEQDDDDNWRCEVDFNFTGGSSPTATGWLVLRWAV